MANIRESDWKIFNKIKDIAIERFCEKAIVEYKEILEDTAEHVHNRYLLHYKVVQVRNKQMALIFDGHSRSKAWLQLLAMRGECLVDDSLVAELSEEFREATNPERSGGW